MSPRPTIQEGLHTQRISISEHAKYIKIRATCFLTDHYLHAVFSSATWFLNNMYSEISWSHLTVLAIKEMDCWTSLNPTLSPPYLMNQRVCPTGGTVPLNTLQKSWKYRSSAERSAV